MDPNQVDSTRVTMRQRFRLIGDPIMAQRDPEASKASDLVGSQRIGFAEHVNRCYVSRHSIAHRLEVGHAEIKGHKTAP